MQTASVVMAAIALGIALAVAHSFYTRDPVCTSRVLVIPQSECVTDDDCEAFNPDNRV